MNDDTGKKKPRKRETQAEYFSRLTAGLGAAGDSARPRRPRRSIPAPASLFNAMVLQRIAEGQNRALGAFLEHSNLCEKNDVSLFAIEDLPDIEVGFGLGSLLPGFKEAVEENRRLREVLGERIIRKLV